MQEIDRDVHTDRAESVHYICYVVNVGSYVSVKNESKQLIWISFPRKWRKILMPYLIHTCISDSPDISLIIRIVYFTIIMKSCRYDWYRLLFYFSIKVKLPWYYRAAIILLYNENK